MSVRRLAPAALRLQSIGAAAWRVQLQATLRLHSPLLRGGLHTTSGRSTRSHSLASTNTSEAASASGSSGATVIHHHHHTHHHHYAGVTPTTASSFGKLLAYFFSSPSVAAPAEPSVTSSGESSSMPAAATPVAASAAPVAGVAAADDVIPTDPLVFRSLIRRWRALAEARDFRGILDLLSEDCVLSDPLYRHVRGRQNILPLLERSLGGGFHFVRASFNQYRNWTMVYYRNHLDDEEPQMVYWTIDRDGRIDYISPCDARYDKSTKF